MSDTTNLTPLEALMGSDLRVCHYGRMPDDVQRAYDKVFAALAQPAQAPATVLPDEPLWDHKGNVRHDAVDRLGARQRAAQAPAQPAPRSLLVRARNLLSHPAHWSESNAESRHRLSVEIAEYLAQPAPQPSTTEAVERGEVERVERLMARAEAHDAAQEWRSKPSAVEALAKGETK